MEYRRGKTRLNVDQQQIWIRRFRTEVIWEQNHKHARGQNVSKGLFKPERYSLSLWVETYTARVSLRYMYEVPRLERNSWYHSTVWVGDIVSPYKRNKFRRSRRARRGSSGMHTASHPASGSQQAQATVAHGVPKRKNRFAIMASSKRTDNDTFIEMVKCYSVLYDLSHTDYKNIFLKNKIWDEIGEKCNIRGDEAKVKWKNLRDTFGKYLKSIKTTTGQSASKNYSRYSKWQWASSMEFLKDYIGFAPTATNVEEESVSDTQNITETESNNDNSSSVASSERHTLRSGSRKRTSVNEHPVDTVITYLNTKADKLSSTEHVMLGYAKTIDSFSERRKIITKMKIAQVMMDAELEEEQERSLRLQTASTQFEGHRCVSQQSCYSLSPQSTNNSKLQSDQQCVQDNALFPNSAIDQFEGLDFEQEIDDVQQKN